MFDRLIPASHRPICVVVIAAALLVPLAVRVPTFGAENPAEGGGYLQASKPISQSGAPELARPSTGGLASLYPGDEGIERDPRVLFVEDFETGTPGQIGARWGQIYREENVTLSEDIHADSPGYKSVHYKDNAHLYTHTKAMTRIRRVA